MSRLSQILPILYFTTDVLLLILAFFGSGFFFKRNYFEGSQWIALPLAIVLWAVIGYLRRLYQSNLHNGFSLRMISYSKTYLIFAAGLMTISYIIFDFPADFFKSLLSFALFFLAANILVNSILIKSISLWRSRGANIKHTLVIGAGELALRVAQYFEANPDFGFRLKGHLKSAKEECKVGSEKVLGTLRHLKPYLMNNSVDEIIIALPYGSTANRIKFIVGQADLYGIRVSFIPDYDSLFGKHCKIIHDRGLEAVNVRQLPLDEFYPIVEKVVFDFLFASAVLFFLFPVFAAIAILIKLDSPGPVFYCPVRVGRGGRNFKVYKFRTMYENDPVIGGTRSTQVNDPRITRVGKVLRKYNLDELPQFLNVFLGDMSVVGPRPHRNYLNKQMRERYDKYMIRHYFKPGITGWAQVNGWRGPAETETQIIERTIHDLWYFENWSFLLDLKIIWLTIFSRKAYQNAF
ncbi:MAG TPA: exopolysaccharide biosynthesis polyprenyl glycosylphosphotransferase [Chryseosolibacter sp.]